jgi:hypothetical protein
MKSFIGLLLLSLTFLWANRLSVGNGEIVLKIDMKQYTYQVGEYPLPKDAVQVCYVSGEGKAILNNDPVYSLDNHSQIQCYQVPQKQKHLFGRFIDKFKKVYTMEVIKIDPTIKSAAGTRNLQVIQQLTDDVEIEEGISCVIIESNYFGSPPVYLKIKDLNNKVKQVYINKEQNTSLFILDTKELSDGDTIEIINNKEKTLLKRKLYFIK